jgi:HlyD family secretion protein
MPLPKPKYPGVLAAALVVTGLLLWGFWPRPVMVETVPVKRAPMMVTVEEDGRTRVIDRYVISAPVDGVACRVQLDVGDRVEEGRVLLGITPLASQVLDPRRRAEAEAQVAAAAAALAASKEDAEAADARAEFASADFARLQPLAEQGVISREALDKARMDLLSAKAGLRAALHAVDVARYELAAARTALEVSAAQESGEPAERVLVRAPTSGRILKLARECEGPVTTGEPLLEMGDPARLEVAVDVLSADAVQIRPGMRVLFERWGGEQPLQGVVRTVEPVGITKISALGVEEQRVLVIADFASPPALWERLGDGYRVEARFVLWQDDDVLQVPASSLFRHDGGWALFVVTDGRATLRRVELGQRNGLLAQVLHGVAVGDVVVNHPNDEVEDGRRVAPLE